MQVINFVDCDWLEKKSYDTDYIYIYIVFRHSSIKLTVVPCGAMSSYLLLIFSEF